MPGTEHRAALLFCTLLLACQGRSPAAAPSVPPSAAAVAPAPPAAPGMAMPTVFIADEIPALDGQKVTVHGTYTQVDVRQRSPRDTRPPQLDGHVALVLADGRRIYLEPSWSAVALRPAEERARLDGKAVEVVGLLHATMPEPEIPVASLTAPCISAVESLRLKE